MDLSEILKSLAIDTWYKALLALGGVVLVISFFWDAKGITNQQLQLLAGGTFLIGLGEWKNHKTLAWLKEANYLTGGPGILSTKIRKADIVGILLEIAGGALLLVGIVKILTD